HGASRLCGVWEQGPARTLPSSTIETDNRAVLEFPPVCQKTSPGRGSGDTTLSAAKGVGQRSGPVRTRPGGEATRGRTRPPGHPGPVGWGGHLDPSQPGDRNTEGRTARGLGTGRVQEFTDGLFQQRAAAEGHAEGADLVGDDLVLRGRGRAADRA